MTQPTGAVPLDQDRRSKRPWWLWALLALAALLLLSLLLSQCGGEDDADTTAVDPTPSVTDGADATSEPSLTATTSSSPSASAPSAPSAAAAGGTAGGQLTAGGTALLPLAAAAAADGTLTEYVGQPSEGTGVLVQSVPADEGFWVGPSETDRVWVQLTGSGESTYTVMQGDTVDFTGEVVATPADFAAQVGVDAAEGADQLNAAGAHIEVPRERLTQSG